MAPHIARLDSRALVRVTGTDARPFLHNLLTQDVEGLGAGDLRHGALLSAQGRLLFDVFLWGETDGVTLETGSDRRDGLIQRLGLYRLRADVEIVADDRPVFACWNGAEAGFVSDPRLSELGGRMVAGAPATSAGEQDWRVQEIAHGVPGPQDWPDDKTYPIEANFDLLNGVDFQKGCFIGQETTSRMKRRGAIKSRMLPIRFDGAPPAHGSEIMNGDLRAGEVLGGVEGRAMALVRLDRIEGDLTVGARALTVERPDWLTG